MLLSSITFARVMVSKYSNKATLTSLIKYLLLLEGHEWHTECRFKKFLLIPIMLLQLLSIPPYGMESKVYH